MGLIDITNIYYDESQQPTPPEDPVIYPDEWRMKINDSVVGSLSGYDLSGGCYYGLGSASAMSNIGYMDVRKMFEEKKVDPNASGTVHFTTNYGVSDFTFSIGRLPADAGNTIDAGRNAFIGNAPKKAEIYNVIPYVQRIAPDPIQKERNETTGLYANYSLNWTPISRFMFRDVIAVIYVDAASSLSSNSSSYTLDDYLANHTSDHSYITGVYLRLFMNVPNSYSIDPDDPDQKINWNTRFIDLPGGNIDTAVPWSTVFSPGTGTGGNISCAICHLQSTGIENNYINWAFNKSAFGNQGAHFKILGGLQSGSNQTNVTVIGQSGEIHHEGEAYIPFALLDTWEIQAQLNDNNNPTSLRYRAFRNYDSTFEEECMQQAACFCLFFMKHTPASNQSLEDPDVYLGIPENGIGNGKYTNDTDKKKAAFQWDGRSDGTSYFPGGGGGGVFPDLSNNLTTPWNRNFNFNDNFHCLYVISESDVRNMSNDLVEWTATLSPSDITDLFKTITDFSYKEFLTNNPLECVVSLKKFPFEIPHGGTQSAVRLGNYTTAASGYAPSNLVYEFEQSVGFPVLDQSHGPCFLDYEPYTNAEILIPYAGMVSIPPSKFIGKDVNIKYVCDLQTGQMTVYISANEVLFTSIKSNCAFEIAVTGLDKATLDSQYNNANVSAGQQALSIGSELVGIGKNGVSSLKNAMFGNAISGLSGITSTLADLASTALSAQSAAYDIEHMRIPFSQVGNASPICSGYGAQTAILYVYRPLITTNLETFRQTHGFACCDVGTISSLGLTGYTEISQIDLSGFAATAAEKDMIKGLCASGIYL